jgi:hypothetical protein
MVGASTVGSLYSDCDAVADEPEASRWMLPISALVVSVGPPGALTLPRNVAP